MPYNRLGNLQTLDLEPGVKSDNACVILTMDNIVEIMGTLTCDSSAGASYTRLATLPEDYRPKMDIYIPVAVDDGELSIPQMQLIMIGIDGGINLTSPITGGAVYLNGIIFNVCDSYYTSAIGNNFAQGTSPSSW